jgi:hypothetical protein
VAKLLTLKGGLVPEDVRKRVPSAYIGDARDDPRFFPQFVDMVSHLLYKRRQQRAQAKRAGQTEAGAEPIEVGPLLDPREARRAENLSEELARLALHFPGPYLERKGKPIRPSVVAFREDYLGERTLSKDEAGRFLDSDALRWLRKVDFDRLEIPLVGHQAKITNQDYVHEKNETYLHTDFDIRWEDQEIETWVRHGIGYETEELVFPNEAGYEIRGKVPKFCVLADLARLAKRLAHHYLWSEMESSWFILTGRAPSTPCFRATREGGSRNDHVQYRLNLSIQPWVSAKTVMKAFRQWQLEFLQKDNRQITVDRLELCEFAYERRHRGVPWRKILDEWKRKHPKQRAKYRGKDAFRNFRRDAEQVYKLLLTGR